MTSTTRKKQQSYPAIFKELSTADKSTWFQSTTATLNLLAITRQHAPIHSKALGKLGGRLALIEPKGINNGITQKLYIKEFARLLFVVFVLPNLILCCGCN